MEDQRYNRSMRLPRLALVAGILALIMGGLGLVNAALVGPIILAPIALIQVIGGIGTLRRNVWSAYGLALYSLGQVAFACVLLTRLPPAARFGFIVGSVLFGLGLGCLFFFAGRALANAGATYGSPIPWVAVAAITTIPVFFVQTFVMPSGSMENTLLIGDRMIVQSFPKPSVHRGDVVAFDYPVDRLQQFIKRVIGVPGDRIRIRDKVVYRNGIALNEPYARHGTSYMDSYRDNFPSEPNTKLPAPALDMLAHDVVNGELVVPEHSYFVLGDSRDDSLDSRYWGFVSASDVVGKPLFIYDSKDQQPGSQTRWSRIFKRVNGAI
jgi:signal peptidase I